MIMTLLNWIWIGISCFLIGYAAVRILNRITGSSIHNMSMYWVLGLCCLITYAQYFSIVSKVGIAANMGLLCCIVVVYVVFRRDINVLCCNAVKAFKEQWRNRFFLTLILLLLFGMVLLITSSSIRHYDTLLYHAQSIRWIEEYGIVKGLGNLHNRFAYNSSVFCLQALFSMPYIFGQSMHAVNGFCVCLFLIYSIVTLKCLKERKVYVSDLLRVTLIICINVEAFYKYISSAGSDTLAILLFFYVLIEFISLAEQEGDYTAEYACLCIIGICAITVKLSVAMIVLIVILPLIQMIQKQEWKKIGFFVLIGVLVLLPYLLRNVIISGYLIYPYEKIDLFNVDWKMFPYTLAFDRNEIKVYGRGYWNVLESFDLSFLEWFPVWLENLSVVSRCAFALNVVLTPVSLVWSIVKFIKKEKSHLVVVLVIISNLLLWFNGAPLIRYGFPFLFLLPVYMLGNMIIRLKWNDLVVKNIVLVILILGICSNWGMLRYMFEQVEADSIERIRPADYNKSETVEYSVDGVVVEVPAEGDQVGYYAFPSTPYSPMLEWIELRGDDLADGFRIKEEYIGKYVPNNGTEQEINVFE